MRPLRTLDDIKARNAWAGNHWFTPDTMRWFRSRVSETVYPIPATGGAFFVTSERNDMGDHPRLYSVRYASRDGRIHTVGEFQGYRSSGGAHGAARRWAAATRLDPVLAAGWEGRS